MDWKRNLFEAGRWYRVLADNDVWLDRCYRFRTGEVLQFRQEYLSHYDGLAIFLFELSTGEERYWALHDDDPTDKWKTVFERIGETEG